VASAESALIESATGTGKSLALICSTLAAQKKIAAEIAKSKDADTAVAETAAAPAAKKRKQDKDEEVEATTAAKAPSAESPRTFYGTRTHA
jgi:Rad3-related DNA helicase